MLKNHLRLLGVLLFFLQFSSCSSDDYVSIEQEMISPVVFDLTQMPFPNLSDYNFFEGNIKDLNPVYGVLPYTLNSSLFTDYAQKKRFIWMPAKARAFYVSDYDPLDFPIGTILIKNFYYENILPDNSTKIIESRIMYRKEEGWDFANYLWNDDQTKAVFTSSPSFQQFDWVEGSDTKSVNYKIPSNTECFVCHNVADKPQPIGAKPQNLNMDFNYKNGTRNQLEKWIDIGYLEDNLPSNIASTINWKNETESLSLRTRSYLDVNCAHCHSELGYCNYRPLRLSFKDTEDPSNMGVCVEPDTNLNDDLAYIITPRKVANSVMHFRLSSILDEYKMPLIGRTLSHSEGVQLIEEYINSLTLTCN